MGFWEDFTRTGSFSESIYYRHAQRDSFSVWTHPIQEDKSKKRGMFGFFFSGFGRGRELDNLVANAYQQRIARQDFRETQADIASGHFHNNAFGPPPSGYWDMNGLWHDN